MRKIMIVIAAALVLASCAASRKDLAMAAAEEAWAACEAIGHQPGTEAHQVCALETGRTIFAAKEAEAARRNQAMGMALGQWGQQWQSGLAPAPRMQATCYQNGPWTNCF